MTDLTEFLIEQFKEVKTEIRTQTIMTNQKLDDNLKRLTILETSLDGFKGEIERRISNIETKTKETDTAFDIIRISFEILNRQFISLKQEYDTLFKKTFGESKNDEEKTVIEKINNSKHSIETISNKMVEIENSLKKISGNDKINIEQIYLYYQSNKIYNNYVVKSISVFIKYKNNIKQSIINLIKLTFKSMIIKLILLILGTSGLAQMLINLVEK